MANPKDRAAAVARKLVRVKSVFSDHPWIVTIGNARFPGEFKPLDRASALKQREFEIIKFAAALRKAGVR